MAPKFWAEHMGVPYHQASMREEEMRGPGPNEPHNAATTRRFLRYGYGDYLRDHRKFGIIHRIWPGTQRHHEAFFFRGGGDVMDYDVTQNEVTLRGDPGDRDTERIAAGELESFDFPVVLIG
jgi:hypothetical protein